MAVRKFFLAVGQSNAMEVGDAMGWEDLHPYVALRSSGNAPGQTPEFSAGAYTGIATLPYTFIGGPRLGWKSDGDETRRWQNSNTAGLATQAVNYLTFYNPVPSRINLGDSWATTYPGEGTILEGSSADQLKTSVWWQYDPVGTYVTRQRTGITYTIASAVAGTGWDKDSRATTLDLTEPMVPPPEDGETFTYWLTGGADSAVDEVIFRNRFGGIVDLGSAFDVLGVSAATENGKHSCAVGAQGDPIGARVTLRSRPVRVGQTITFGLAETATSYGTNASGSMTSGQTKLVNVGGAYASRFSVGDPVTFKPGGTLPGNLSSGTTYFVHSVALNETTGASEVEIKENLSDTSPITLAAGFVATAEHPTMTGVDELPSELAQATEYYVVRLAGDQETVEVPANAWATDKLDFDHSLATGEKVTLSGTLPSELDEGVAYYVREVSSSEVTLHETPMGPTIPWTASGGGVATITRLESGSQFYISNEVSGTPLTVTSSTYRPSIVAAQLLSVGATFGGSLTGLRVRCTSGANVGSIRDLGDLKYVDGSPNTYASVAVTPDWDATPLAADRYLIEPPQDSGDAIPFREWAVWLPWSPFEGSADWTGPAPAAIYAPSGVELQVVIAGITVPPVGTKVRFHSNGELPKPLEIGRDYYVQKMGGQTIFVKESYASTTPIMGVGDSGTPGAAHVITSMTQVGKQNPHPPGFNYPNHYATPRLYQPYAGPSLLNIYPRIAFHVPLAYNLHDNLGEAVYVAVSAVGGTSLGHKDVAPSSSRATLGWYDSARQKSWAPGGAGNCFERLEDVLSATKTAFAKQGDTGECVGIFFIQGEEDAAWLAMSENYEASLQRFKDSARSAVKSRGLFSGSAATIPFIQPQISSQWTYAKAVNAAITKLSERDPYARTFSTSDFTFMPDGVHYDGASLSLLGDRAYEAWRAVQRVGTDEVSICNLALSNLGESATVTSIDPPDGSAEAALCAKFYATARDIVLERHTWDFSTKFVVLTAVEESRPDWSYAYTYPDDVSGIISLVDKNIGGNQYDAGYRTSQPYTVELDVNGDRIIYTNQQNAALRYSAKVTDTTKFSQLFVKALSWELAASLAGPLVKGDEGAASATRSVKMSQFYGAQAQKHDSSKKRQTDMSNFLPFRR